MKVLFCSSNPKRNKGIDHYNEYYSINANLNGPTSGKTAEFVQMDSPTPQEFVRRLYIEDPRILHFSGDSSNSTAAVNKEDGEIEFEGIYMWKEKGGDIVNVDQEVWATIFEELEPLLKEEKKIIVFSVFHSGRIAQMISHFQKIDYCIAFVDKFDPALKIHFFNGFYFALANGKEVAESFIIGRLSGMIDDNNFKNKVALYREGQIVKI